MKEYNDINKQMERGGFSFKFIGSVSIRYDKQKQPSRGVLSKSCSETMQQLYRRTPMPNLNFAKFLRTPFFHRTSLVAASAKKNYYTLIGKITLRLL